MQDVSKDLLVSIRALQRDATKIYQDVVLPHWTGEFHGFGPTLHAYMMSILAYVDLASTYWKGSQKNQTSRMEQFLAEYVGVDAEASEVVVKMWRHCLMHTAKPRIVKRADAAEYYWLLHWREHLPLKQHMTFTDSGETRILNIGLLYFLADFIAGCEKLLADLKADPTSGKRAVLVYDKVREQQL